MQRKISGIVVTAALVAALAVGTVFGADAGSITGTVKFEGSAPKPKTIKMTTEKICHAAIEKSPVMDEKVVVNDNKTLKYVFVYVKEGLKGSFPAPKEPVTFDQKHCWYKPHVFGIMVSQPLKILNSDGGVLHNIHSMPKKNKSFNKGMPGKEGASITETFSAPEVMVKIKCDVHSWMTAYAGVLDHPFFAVTDDKGRFEIKNLPAGEYTVEAWHEKYGTQTMKVKVGKGGKNEADFTFKG